MQFVGIALCLLLPPGDGNPRNSEGDFIQLNDGRTLFVYTHFYGGGGDHSNAHLMGRYSSDGGKTWTEDDTMIVRNEGGMNVMSISLLRLQSGEIALFYLRKNSTDDCRPVMRISTDEGQTWGEPIECITEPIGYYVLNNDRVIQLESGRLLAPVARHNLLGGEWTGRGVAMCFLSDDNGKTWYKSDTELEGPEGSGSGLQEPGVIELRDGRIMMLSRTDQGCQLRSYSEDGGVTWSPVEMTDIKSPVSPATFEYIPGTDDILLVWNDHSDPEWRGRTPLTVAISHDHGQTWEHARNIEDDPDGWYCYTAMDFVEDRVLLGYCATHGDMPHLSQTQITAIDIDWLYE